MLPCLPRFIRACNTHRMLLFRAVRFVALLPYACLPAAKTGRTGVARGARYCSFFCYFPHPTTLCRLHAHNAFTLRASRHLVSAGGVWWRCTSDDMAAPGARTNILPTFQAAAGGMWTLPYLAASLDGVVRLICGRRAGLRRTRSFSAARQLRTLALALPNAAAHYPFALEPPPHDAQTGEVWVAALVTAFCWLYL